MPLECIQSMTEGQIQEGCSIKYVGRAFVDSFLGGRFYGRASWLSARNQGREIMADWPFLPEGR